MDNDTIRPGDVRTPDYPVMKNNEAGNRRPAITEDAQQEVGDAPPMSTDALRPSGSSVSPGSSTSTMPDWLERANIHPDGSLHDFKLHEQAINQGVNVQDLKDHIGTQRKV